MQKTASFNDIKIASVKGNNYRIHFSYKSNDEALNVMKNSDLKEKNESLQNYKN